MKEQVNYGFLTFNKIYNKFRLTEKFFIETKSHVYKEMLQEWQNLMAFNGFFRQYLDDNYYEWFGSVRQQTKTGKKGKKYCFMILFDAQTGLLSHINVYDLPQSNDKRSKERRKEVIKTTKEIVGYFIAVMIHHGYIERIN